MLSVVLWAVRFGFSAATGDGDGLQFLCFSISFSDARRLQGIEGGEKEAYGAQPTPYKQANKHIHIVTHVQMHSDAKSVTSPRAGARLPECAECVCERE